MNDKKSTAKGLLITRIGVGIIAALFLIFGLFVKSTDPTLLYSALHPASLLNILGVIFFLLFLTYIAGLGFVTKLIEKVGVPPASVWPNYAGFGCGALGVILMYA